MANIAAWFTSGKTARSKTMHAWCYVLLLLETEGKGRVEVML